VNLFLERCARYTRSFCIAAFSLLALGAYAAGDRNLAVSPAPAEKRVALIIGNGAYQSRDLAKLANPANDAEDMANALKGFGFDVIAYKDLGRRAMKDAIAEFGRRAGNAGASMFYFAGHGVQVKNQNYLMPVDATVRSEADVTDEGININLLLEEMENAKSTVNIVMIDACRDNPITGKFRGGGTRGLAAPGAVPKGTVIVYATDPGNTAADGDGRNGLFTAGVLAGFKEKDLSLDGVLTVASAKVEEQSKGRQTPYINGPKLVQKNFSFAGRSPGTQPVASQPVPAPPRPAGAGVAVTASQQQSRTQASESATTLDPVVLGHTGASPSATRRAVRVTADTSVYSRPETSSPMTGRAKRGDTLLVESESVNSAGKWYRVAAADRELRGYLHAAMVKEVAIAAQPNAPSAGVSAPELSASACSGCPAEIKEYVRGNMLHILVKSKGESTEQNVAQRKTQAQRDAMRKIRLTLVTRFSGPPFGMGREEILNAIERGSIIDANFFDDSRAAELTFEVVLVLPAK